MGPNVHDVAAAHLTGAVVYAAPEFAVELLARSIASLGAGPDHLEGEEIVSLLLRRNSQGATWVLNPVRAAVRSAIEESHVWRNAALLTDGRLVLRDEVDRFDIALHEIVGARTPNWAAGLFFSWVKFDLTDGRTLDTAALIEGPLARFALVIGAGLRSGQVGRRRVAAPRSTADDPSGANGFLARMLGQDSRARFLLNGVAHQTKSGEISVETGRELAARVALLHRTTLGGRGTHRGRWISCLRAQELLAFFERFGRPEPRADQNGMRVCHFIRDERFVSPSAAISLPLSGKKSEWFAEKALRVCYVEEVHPRSGPHTAYLLQAESWGEWTNLCDVHDKQLYNIHLELLAFEAQLLARRLLFPGVDDVPALLRLADGAVDDKLASLNRSLDPALFRTPRDFQSLVERMPSLRGAGCDSEGLNSPAPPRPRVGAGPRASHAAYNRRQEAPLAIGMARVVNIVGGALTFFIGVFVWCCAGAQLQQAALDWLATVSWVDIERTRRAFAGIWCAQLSGMVALAIVRIVMASVLPLQDGKSRGFFAWGLVALAGADLLVMNPVGILASIVTLFCAVKARAWVRGD